MPLTRVHYKNIFFLINHLNIIVGTQKNHPKDDDSFVHMLKQE